MNCECKTKTEALLLEHFKSQQPTWADHKVEVDGYSICFDKAMNMSLRMGTEYTASGTATLKNGSVKKKKLTGNFVFNYCPFCGVSAKPAEKPA